MPRQIFHGFSAQDRGEPLAAAHPTDVGRHEFWIQNISLSPDVEVAARALKNALILMGLASAAAKTVLPVFTHGLSLAETLRRANQVDCQGVWKQHKMLNILLQSLAGDLCVPEMQTLCIFDWGHSHELVVRKMHSGKKGF